MRDIRDITENSLSEKEALNALTDNIMHTAKASTILLDIYGKIVSSACIEDRPPFEQSFFDEINGRLLRLRRPCVIDTEHPELECTAIPIYAISQRVGTALIYGTSAYNTDTALSPALNACALLLRCINAAKNKVELQKEETVKAALGSLSFSELDAVINVFGILENGGDMIIASRLSQQCGITRSVIVNALKKLESAAVIETQSRGMKGTYINVLNPCIYKQLKHYRRLSDK